MADGGRYADLAAWVMKVTGAAGVALVVVGGNEGDGGTIEIDAERGPAAVASDLVLALRAMASQFERDAVEKFGN